MQLMPFCSKAIWLVAYFHLFSAEQTQCPLWTARKGERASAGPGSMLLQGYHDGAPGNRTCQLPNGEGKPCFVPRQMKIQITRLKLHAQNNTLKCGGVRHLHAFQSASALPRALWKHGRWSVTDDEKNCLTVSLLFQPSLLSLLVCKGSGMSAVGYYGPFLHMLMQSHSENGNMGKYCFFQIKHWKFPKSF